jgi:flavin reductase (DIM6/NTAB) family NADH-FMN oxidoreductase RutF
MVSLAASELSTFQLYDIMAGWIVPRPIAFVSTVSADGARNLAPFSYFMPGGVNPPSLCFCPLKGADGQDKDTLRNIRATGEFVVNLLNRPMADGMNETSPTFPPEVDEWPLSGFTSEPSQDVRPERVAESPVSFECRLHTLVEHGSGPFASAYVVGEVLRVTAHPELWADGQPQPLPSIARLGGAGYLDLDGGKLFELHRPKSAS